MSQPPQPPSGPPLPPEDPPVPAPEDLSPEAAPVPVPGPPPPPAPDDPKVLVEPPFAFGSVPFAIRPPRYSLTAVVKGTFRLVPGAAAAAGEGDPPPVTGDDGDAQHGLRYPSDFAPLKPRADLLLVGKCHPPGGECEASCPITFRVGDRSRTLEVFGNRWWERRGGRWRMAGPKPFGEMELTWGRAFGGQGFDPNPAGMGTTELETMAGLSVRPLPNVEDPRRRIRSPRDRPPPACFAPVAPLWEERARKLGTYGDRWLEERWPWFPEDMDWGYFNAAPEPMQTGYLRGDEDLFFENLHPEHPRYVSRLPGLRVRCFLCEVAGEEERRVREVAMKLDTLWVDMEAERLVLVWRGVTGVRTLEHEEVERFLVASEPLSEPPRPADDYVARLLEAAGAESRASSSEPRPKEPEP